MVNIPFFVTPGSGWVGFLVVVVVVVVVGVPVVVISPVFLLSNKLPQTVYILFPLNGPDEDQQESHRKGDSTYCSFVATGVGHCGVFEMVGVERKTSMLPAPAPSLALQS